MLIAQDVAFDDHHFRLIAPTDFNALAGTVSLLQSSTALARTALSLIASGRMKPDAGAVYFLDEPAPQPEEPEEDDDDAAAEPVAASSLRRRTAIVDSPGISAPEHHMTVRQVVSESLGLRPVFAGLSGEQNQLGQQGQSGQRGLFGQRGRRPLKSPMRSMDWLQQQGMAELARQKVVALDAETRLRLLIELAFADTAVRCAVLDSPDRHRISAERLLALLEELVDADPSRCLLAVVQRVPEGAESTISGEISIAAEADSGMNPAVAEDAVGAESAEPGEQPLDDPTAGESAEAETEDLSDLDQLMQEDEPQSGPRHHNTAQQPSEEERT